MSCIECQYFTLEEERRKDDVKIIVCKCSKDKQYFPKSFDLENLEICDDFKVRMTKKKRHVRISAYVVLKNGFIEAAYEHKSKAQKKCNELYFEDKDSDYEIIYMLEVEE